MARTAKNIKLAINVICYDIKFYNKHTFILACQIRNYICSTGINKVESDNISSLSYTCLSL